nr:helix-turn-helix domain-containing protein [Gallibacterium anatis]
MNKGDLQKLIETGPPTILRMGRNESVRLELLGRICDIL